MNEQLQKTLAEIIAATLNTAGQAKGFLLGQLPDVVQQLLLYNAVKSALFQGLSVVYVIALVTATCKTFKHIQKRVQGTYNAGSEWFALFGLALTIPGFVGIFDNFDWLKIWLAPKLYLLDYVKSFVK